jgi:hypothetical protein
MVWNGVRGEEAVDVVLDLRIWSSTRSLRWLMKVAMEPNLDSTSEKMARDSKRVLVGGEMSRRTWRASNEVVEGKMLIIQPGQQRDHGLSNACTIYQFVPFTISAGKLSKLEMTPSAVPFRSLKGI